MNKLNNIGSLGLTILISLIVLSITGFGLYYFYFNKIEINLSQQKQ
jgi:hypothetical protein